MASWVSAIEAGSATSQSAGILWIEFNRLKREGQNVGRIACHLSELEETLRCNPQDASAKRHILNNLNHEIEILKRRGT